MNKKNQDYYFGKIQKLLEEKIGLLADSLSFQNWCTCIDKRLAKTGKKNYPDYYALLMSSVTELQELIDLITIPETWFYREDRAFKFLTEHAKKYGGQYRMGLPLKVLSLGCSTGEEPYSIVMCLLEAGMPLGSFRVEGVDVSRECLSIAQKGLYGSSSFRSLKLKIRKEYFFEQGDKYQLSDQVRFSVRFKKDNVLNFPSGFSKEVYDVIFCRNLLIYLSPLLQENLLKRLERNLVSGGILILGESEYGKINQLDFDATSLNGATAYCKRNKESEQPVDYQELYTKESNKESSIDLIRQFADRGDFVAAKREIDSYHEMFTDDPEFHFLNGLIHHATNEQDLAVKFLQKAVYLEPNHVEALTYLSLLTRGALSERYRVRANQVKKET